jgi:small subunit ribosomal protein S7
VPRKGSPDRTPTRPDPKYGSVLVTQLTARILRDGKRSLAEGIVYDALANIGNRTQGGDPISVLKRAVENVRPAVEVKSRRVGGSTYQVPVEVRPERRTALAYRWIINFARARGEKGFSEKLANELLDAAGNRGAAVKRREDTHRMADANKAFAHFRW